MNIRDRYRGCLLGLACGDAVGTTVEFSPRGSFPPLTDMVGGGPFGLQPGQWTDDTAMALCLGESLAELGLFDAEDQIRRYVRWRDEGHNSVTGRCFDIGGATTAALSRYLRSGYAYAGSTDERSAGNGSIMRLAPVPIFFHPNRYDAISFAALSSSVTHAAEECVDACRLMAAVLCNLFDGVPKETALVADQFRRIAPTIAAIAAGSFRGKSEADISGSGYVVRSLEAALWCVNTTDSFRDAILRAANLGDDADTTAAVTGQLAGALYGEPGIPPEWLDRLAWADKIRALADRLGERGAKVDGGE